MLPNILYTVWLDVLNFFNFSILFYYSPQKDALSVIISHSQKIFQVHDLFDTIFQFLAHCVLTSFCTLKVGDKARLRVLLILGIFFLPFTLWSGIICKEITVRIKSDKSKISDKPSRIL